MWAGHHARRDAHLPVRRRSSHLPAWLPNSAWLSNGGTRGAGDTRWHAGGDTRGTQAPAREALTSGPSETPLSSLAITSSSTGAPSFYFWDNSSPNPNMRIHAQTSVSDGTWHHIAASMSGEENMMYLYVDGQLEASASTPGEDSGYSPFQPVVSTKKHAVLQVARGH